jgi:stage II sporulation protein D
VRLARFEGKTALPLAIDVAYDVLPSGGGSPVAWGREIVEGRLERDGGTIRINGEALPGSGIRIVPRDRQGAVTLDGTAYAGILEVRCGGAGDLELVNEVPLETYLEGVVGSEMPSSYPIEALRAQAIAARTYAVHDVLVATGGGVAESGSETVLDDSVLSQVYRGRETATGAVVAAVRSTAGVVLTYAGEPIRSYFHSTCGGRTTNPRVAFEEPFPPPLQGAPCGFCNGAPHAVWSCTLDPDVLRETATELGLPGSVVAVEPVRESRGERIRRLRVRTDLADREVSALDFRLAAGPSRVRSTWWTSARMQSGTLRIEGRGWGHGVGMCQVGARGMALEGRDAASILGRYFPGASLGRAYPDTLGP